MTIHNVLHRICSFLKPQRPNSKTEKRGIACPRLYRPWIERLEERLAPTTVTWNNAAGGDWDTASNWTDNLGIHRLPGATDDVAIANLNAGAAVTHTQSAIDSVNSVTASALITLSGGTLNVAGNFSDSSTVTLSGGTLANATVQAGTILKGNGALSGVTLDGTLDENVSSSSVTISNGLTLGSGLVETTTTATLNFSGTQDLAGTGEVLFNGGDNHNNRLNVQGNGTLTIDPNITIDGLTATINAGSGAIDNEGTISVGTSLVGSSTGTPTSASLSGGTFTIDGAWTNEPGATMQAVNDGNLALNGMGANDSGNIVPSGVWTNDSGATISVVGNSDHGGSLTLAGNGWSNAGNIAMTNSSVFLGGTFTLATLGTFTRSGGTVYLSGTLTNSSTTLALNNTTGSWELDGGTINGGTVTTSGTSVLGVDGSGTVSGVTLDGTLDENEGGSLTITNLTLASGLVETTTTATLNFSGTQDLAGTGEVLFNGGDNHNNRLNVQGNGTLTIDPNITIDGLTATINAGSGAIDNEGTISVGTSLVGSSTGTPTSASLSGGTFTIDGAWTNEPGATMQAVNDGNLALNGMGANDSGNIVPSGVWTNDSGATISVVGNSDHGGSLTLAGNGWSNAGNIAMTNSSVFLGGTFTLATLGTFTRSGGTVYLSGTLTNSSTTLALNITTGSWELDGGTVAGGTVTTAGTAELIGTSRGGILASVTLAGVLDMAVNFDSAATVTGGLTLDNVNINVGNGSSVAFSGSQSLGGTGTVTFSDGSDTNAIFITGTGNTLIIGPNILIHGNLGSIIAGTFVGSNTPGNNSTFINEGTISADTGQGYISLLATNWSNTGTIQALNGSSVILGGNTSATAEGGSFTNSGTIVGSTGFIYLKSTLNNEGSTLALNATTGSWYITYGTINGGTVSTTGGAELIGTNDGGALSGVTLAGTLDLTSPSFTAAKVTLSGGLTLNLGSINLAGGRWLSFTGTQTLGGTGTVTLNNMTSGGGLILPNAGDTLTIGPSVTIQGSSGTVGSSSGGLITIQGTIEATGGGTLTVQGYTNFAGSALSGGTWGAVANSTLRLVGANIATNAANILLDGAASHIYSGSSGTTNALSGFATNAATGSFTVQNGANLTSAPAFTNAGTLTVNSGGTFIPGGTGVYTQTGGTTILSAGTLGTSGNQINLQGGTLSGPGTVNANLTNAGEVDLGSNPGTLTVTGNYTQTAAGALTLKVGGATAGSQFDQVNVTGTASLGGTLNVTLINGYAPGLEESYDVLNFPGSSGSFATFNAPLINGSPAFATSATPTSFDLVGATTAPDLAVSNIAFTPANPLLNQNVTVTFTVTNLGTVATTAGSWTNSVYLSSEAVVDGNAVLLGRITHSGDLASQADYSATLTAPVPGLAVGSYHVIVVVDSGLQVPDLNRANNTGLAPTELSTQPPALTIGTPLSGTIAGGQDLYYRLNVTPGTNVKLDATFAVAVESELYLKFGALPTVSSFDQTSTNLTNLQPELVLPGGQGGPYYIWLHGREGAGAGQPFTLLASQMTFAANSFTPPSASNQGQVTMDVTGSGFTAQTSLSLKNGSGHTVNAQTVTFINANELNATFDLNNAAIGNYSVVVADSSNSSTAPGSFQVIAQAVSSLLFTLEVNNVSRSFETNPPAPTPGGYSSPPPMVFPSGSDQSSGGGGSADASGPAAPFSVGLKVENKGTNDVDLPSFELEVSNVMGSGIYVMSATTLAPGQTVGLFEEPTPNPDASGTECNISVQELPPQSALDFVGQRPPNISPAAQAAILANIAASVGSTVSSLNAALQADAIYLAQVGESVAQQSDLLSFESVKAEDVEPVPILSSTVDSSFAAPGLALTFERSFVQSLIGRNQSGLLGYGWASNWDLSATTDSTGNAFIQQGGQTTEFLLNHANGSYQSVSATNHEVLTLANGGYTMRGADGSVTAFLPDGQLNYVQDASGNRISAGYTLGLLTSLTQSDGDQLTLAYNAQGLMSGITDPAGNVTRYTYDAHDQLISVGNAQGTYQYTYVNGQGIAQEHALASITNPDGTHSYFSYDGQGRLIEQSQDNEANAIKYAYLSPGGYTETDANGATTKVLYGLSGQPAVITDPLGNVFRVTYNANGQPVLIAYPGGTASSDQYDAQGNVTSATDPLGNTSQITTDPRTDEPKTFQNANGATTSFAYTAQQELQSITQPDGSASQYFYNTQGEVTQSVDALGRSTYYTYDSHGRLILRLNPDSASIAYGYDMKGNLASVTDASGTITMTYDAADNLTKIVYPNGQFLAYTYNAGEQLTQIVDQTGFTENYTYNNLGQLLQVTDAGGNLIVSYTYDLGGRRAGEIHGNGTYTTYTHDANGNVLSLVNFAPNGSINSSFSYTYNALKLVTSMIAAGGTTTYAYDADGQLTSVALPTGETITYQYDAMGNRMVVSDNGATTNYTSNNLNEYTSVGSATYGYDKDGNLTMTIGGPGGNTSYTYDDENRLIKEQMPTDTYTYQYDALGNLVASTDNGQVTRYLINPLGLGNVAAEYNGSGNLIAHFTYGNGLINQVNAAGVANYYDFDATGNTAGLSSQPGTYVASYSYLPFGEVQSATGIVSNPFQYNGEFGVMTTGNGLNFMRARFYSPSIGRFLNPDPTSLAGGANLYAYAANNPISLHDSTGLGPFGPTASVFDVEIVGARISAIAADIGIAGAGVLLAEVAAFVLAGELVIKYTPAGNLNVPVYTSADLQAFPGLQGKYKVVGPVDPNSIYGPGGFGTQSFIPNNMTLPYVITFDNKPTANAPAQIVTVTQQLDANLDWSTFQLDDFDFGGQAYAIPAGLTSYTTVIDARSTVGVYVDVDAEFNQLTGLLTWTFTSIDPTTLDVPLGNVEEGFLPPDVTPPEGEGFVAYVVLPKANDPTGTIINAKGTVIFQAGLPGQSSLDTPAIFNTIDAGAPTSSVTALPAFSPGSFTVNWAGQDDAGGSGIAYYNVYVSDDDGPFTLWQAATTQTSASYTGQDGHTYGFFSVATDNAGNSQLTPVSAQSSTTVDILVTQIVISNLTSNNVTAGGTVTFTATAEDHTGHAVPNYTGTVQLSSSDTKAVFNGSSMPASYTFLGSDAGAHTFTVTLETAGSQTIKLADAVNPNIAAASSPITVNAGALDEFAVSALGGNTVTAGGAFIVTAQAADQFGNPVSNFTGPITFITTDPQVATLPSATVTNGFGVTLGTLKTATGGPWTITATAGTAKGASAPLTVTPANAVTFTVAAPAMAVTNTTFPVTVTALDAFHNVATNYTGTVHLSSTDSAAVAAGDLGTNYTFTTGTGQDNGVHVFNMQLLNSGTQKIIVADTTATIPAIIGTSSAIATSGLTVTALSKTPTGFTATFNQAINQADLTIYGKGNTQQDVLLIGTNSNNGQPYPGTLIVDASKKLITFNVSSNFLAASSTGGSAALPDDTYTVTLLSGVGNNGFQDMTGQGLDAGQGGHADFVGAFTTTYQADKTEVLGIADFARGPNASGDTSTLVKVPNDPANGGHVGIPITIYNAANLTSAGFTLTYNTNILTVTGGLSDPSNAAAGFRMTSNVMSADGVHSVATFAFSDTAILSGTQILGDITAYVPYSARSQYQVKDLLALGNIAVNSGATVVPANAVDVDAYFGDVNGDHHLDGLDKAFSANVASTASSGFSAFTLLDPAIIGDLSGDNAVTANSTSLLSNYLLGKTVAKIPALPNPPIADNLFTSPFAADPTLSLPASAQANASGIVNVPVFLDQPHPAGSTGLVEAELTLAYDPAVLSVSAADITLGSIPSQGTGWQLSATVNAATGEISIQLYSQTPITTDETGSLVNIAFHAKARTGLVGTTVQLLDSKTVLADAQAAMILTPGLDWTAVLTSDWVQAQPTGCVHLPGVAR